MCRDAILRRTVISRLLEYGLDVVPIGIQNERREVAIMVQGPWTRTTIVAPTVGDGGSVEGANGILIWRRKGDMRLACRAVLLGNPEECLASLPIACRLLAIIVEPLNAQRAERVIIERA